MNRAFKAVGAGSVEEPCVRDTTGEIGDVACPIALKRRIAASRIVPGDVVRGIPVVPPSDGSAGRDSPGRWRECVTGGHAESDCADAPPPPPPPPPGAVEPPHETVVSTRNSPPSKPEISRILSPRRVGSRSEPQPAPWHRPRGQAFK